MGQEVRSTPYKNDEDGRSIRSQIGGIGSPAECSVGHQEASLKVLCTYLTWPGFVCKVPRGEGTDAQPPCPVLALALALVLVLVLVLVVATCLSQKRKSRYSQCTFRWLLNCFVFHCPWPPHTVSELPAQSLPLAFRLASMVYILQYAGCLLLCYF